MDISEFAKKRHELCKKLVDFFEENDVGASYAISILPYFIGKTAAGFGMEREEVERLSHTILTYYDNETRSYHEKNTH